MKLVAPIGESSHWAWLGALALDQIDVEVVALCEPERMPNASAGADWPAARIWPVRADTPDGRTPDSRTVKVPRFADILAGLCAVAPDACLVLGGGVLERLTIVAADMIGLAVFRLVTDTVQLLEAGRRVKDRPDLLFIANEELFEAALDDDRFGSTLLPTGHPARDLALLASTPSTAAYSDTRFGSGQASRQIREALARWRTGRLQAGTPDVSVIVPAFKEGANLSDVCARLSAVFDATELAAEILIVDDFSPDDTYAIAQQQMWRSPRIRALTKPAPRGMGSAISYGIRQARSPIVAITMGDGSDDVGQLPEMLRRVRDQGRALVIGCRYRSRRNSAHIPRLYRFWSRLYRLAARALIGVDLLDMTNAFRVFDRRALGAYGLESGGFEISPEITFKAWFSGRGIDEVDVVHLKRASGQSNFSFLRAGPGYGKMLLKALVYRLTGRWFVFDW